MHLTKINQHLIEIEQLNCAKRDQVFAHALNRLNLSHSDVDIQSKEENNTKSYWLTLKKNGERISPIVVLFSYSEKDVLQLISQSVKGVKIIS